MKRGFSNYAILIAILFNLLICQYIYAQNILWSLKIKRSKEKVWSFFSDDRIILALDNDNKLFCINSESGTILWYYQFNNKMENFKIIKLDKLYVITMNKNREELDTVIFKKESGEIISKFITHTINEVIENKQNLSASNIFHYADEKDYFTFPTEYNSKISNYIIGNNLILLLRDRYFPSEAYIRCYRISTGQLEWFVDLESFYLRGEGSSDNGVAVVISDIKNNIAFGRYGKHVFLRNNVKIKSSTDDSNIYIVERNRFAAVNKQFFDNNLTIALA